MSKIQLKNVRLSFPSIFHRSEFEGKEGKFEATFLFSKDDEKLKATLDKAIEAALKESGVKVPSDRRCLRDGDDSEYAGYEGNWSVKAANNKRPTIIDRDKTPLAEDDPNAPYAGCYVNAIIDFWIQDNKYGKRVNANLYGVQFVADGEPFGQGNIDVSDDFDDLEDLEDL